MDDLRDLHRALSERLDGPVEPIAVWQAAEALRMYWRPATVKTVLLAESHVYTLDLSKLLSGGFIRYEPVGAVSDQVRVRVVHLGDKQFGIQVNRTGPVYELTEQS
jgi:hypothetical protein